MHDAQPKALRFLPHAKMGVNLLLSGLTQSETGRREIEFKGGL